MENSLNHTDADKLKDDNSDHFFESFDGYLWQKKDDLNLSTVWVNWKDGNSYEKKQAIINKTIVILLNDSEWLKSKWSYENIIKPSLQKYISKNSFDEGEYRNKLDEYAERSRSDKNRAIIRSKSLKECIDRAIECSWDIDQVVYHKIKELYHLGNVLIDNPGVRKLYVHARENLSTLASFGITISNCSICKELDNIMVNDVWLTWKKNPLSSENYQMLALCNASSVTVLRAKTLYDLCDNLDNDENDNTKKLKLMRLKSLAESVWKNNVWDINSLERDNDLMNAIEVAINQLIDENTNNEFDMSDILFWLIPWYDTIQSIKDISKNWWNNKNALTLTMNIVWDIASIIPFAKLIVTAWKAAKVLTKGNKLRKAVDRTYDTFKNRDEFNSKYMKAAKYLLELWNRSTQAFSDYQNEASAYKNVLNASNDDAIKQKFEWLVNEPSYMKQIAIISLIFGDAIFSQFRIYKQVSKYTIESSFIQSLKIADETKNFLWLLLTKIIWNIPDWLLLV